PQHSVQGGVSFFQAGVRLDVVLLGVLQMRAELFEYFGEIFELLLQAGKSRGEALGVFLNLQAAQAHGNDTQMSVKRVGRDWGDAALAAIGVNGLALAVLGE